MNKLVRFINQGIHDFFIAGGEDFGDSSHQFKNRLSDSFVDGKLMAVQIHLSDEFTNSFVVHESLHGREDVILVRHEERTCYLSCEVGILAFAKLQQPLAILEVNFLKPASGVDPVCLEESKRKAGCEQPPLWPALAATNEEETDIRVCKDNVDTHVPASELTTVFLLPPLSQFLDNGKSNKILALKAVFGLALLINLFHSKVASPTLLTRDGEVDQLLAGIVSNAEEESLEAEGAVVFKMVVDTPVIFHTAPRFGEVRIINHQAGVVRLVVTANEDLDATHRLAPVGTAIVKELIEHIFTTTKFAA